MDTVVTWATTAGVRVLIALVLTVIFFKMIRLVGRRMERTLERRGVDKTIRRTLVYALRLGLKIVVVLCLFGYVGLDTGGLAALLTSLGVGIGLAINGTLANLAGGVLILVTRPFRIDDFIEAQGYSGTVEEIHITYTRLCTPDNKIIYIPNGALSTETIINYSLQKTRRIDEIFSISYREDWAHVSAILREICERHPLVLPDPAPMIRIQEHGDSAIRTLVRVWVKKEDFWTVKFDLLEQVKLRFDDEGIEIPYRQVDVHLRDD